MDLRDEAPIEKTLLSIALLALALFWASSLWRFPGFAYYDEQGLLDCLQLNAEGHPLRSGLFRWTFWLRLQALVDQGLGGGVEALRLPSLLCLLAETGLLIAVVGRRLGKGSAYAAAAVNLLAAFTLIRSRSMLVWSATPCLLLGLLCLLDLARERGRAGGLFACGLAASMGFLEYEAWPMAMGWLCLEAFSGSQRRWQNGALFVAGAAFGLIVIGLRYSSQVEPYLTTRHALSFVQAPLPLAARLAENMSAWFRAQDRVGFLAPNAHPLFPPWALLLAGLGAWRCRQRWPALYGGLALGLLPAIATNTQLEANRYIVAWLPACIFAGAAFSQLAGSFPRWGRALLAIALLGGAWEFTAADASLDAAAQRSHAPSLNWSQAAVRLKKIKPAEGWSMIAGLGAFDDSAFRFLCRKSGLTMRSAGRPVALLEWDYAPAFKAWGLPFDPKPTPFEDRPPSLIYPDPALSARLQSISAVLKPLHLLGSQDLPAAEAAVIRELESTQGAPRDPLLRTLLFEKYLNLASQIRDLDPARVRQAMDKGLVSASGPMLMALKLEVSDPAASRRLAELALSIDPRRNEARALLKRLP